MRFVQQTKKKFGQNFLNNPKTIDRIVNLVNSESPASILEIGPGEGALTGRFSELEIQKVAIEIDIDLVPYLTALYPKTTFINADFMQINLTELFEKYNLGNQTVIYGSLPYNISKQIIRKIVEFGNFKCAIFIVQKEVAQKYTDISPENNKLAVLTSLFAKTEKLFDISPQQFRPVPKVMSSVIKITPRESVLSISELPRFSEFIINAFCMPRKTLHNNLKKLLSERKIKESLFSSEISSLLEKRPEQISTLEYIYLFNALNL